MSLMINVGVVGLGYWGPNILRNLKRRNDIEVKYICDLDDNRLNTFQFDYSIPHTTKDINDVLADKEVSIVFLITPIHTHFKLTKLCLENKKHVWVEKPMCTNSRECDVLANLAKQNNLILFCDHTYMYNPSVQYLKDIIDNEEFGKKLYIDSTRINLGLFQSDINVIWDLIPHDLSIIFYLVNNEKPQYISAQAFDVTCTGKESIGYIILKFNDFICHINVSWLSPMKMRQFIVTTEKKMVVWDDVSIDKIRIYDKGINIDEKDKQNLLISYKNGEINIPVIPNINKESLAIAIDDFISSIKENRVPLSNAEFSSFIVKCIEKINESIGQDGKNISFE